MKKRANEYSDSPETTKKFKSSNQNENSEDDDDVWISPESPTLVSPDSPNAEDIYPKEDHTEGYQLQTLRAAEKALKYYNGKYHKNYQLVDATASSGMLYDRIWIHCNFTGKEQMTSNDDEDSLPKLFFAELCYPSGSTYASVTSCRILKGKEHAGCMSCKDESCSEGVKHPSSGFFFAQNYRPYALRSRSRRG